MKYEVVLKHDFGDADEIVVHTAFGYKSALTAALDRHNDESGVCEIIIKRVEGSGKFEVVD